ncbi:unnamed protein product [Calicophoron daubneyi]|uniref:Proteasome component Ecm29 N-terminal domain-containing protein n=1 Tax=Calicophoron daubneyi TaxID=300641 RepID=A0AAV2TDA9_CALDB
MVQRDLGLSELPLQRRFITDFYSLVLLMPYSLQRLIRFDGNDAAIPDGFNSYDLSRVVHDRFSTINSAEDLEKYKVGLIQFYSRHFFPAEESIIPILFGYGDSRHSVVSAAAKELRTLSMIVDWEDELLLSRIMAWYLGRRREFDPKGRNEPRRLLSANMRIKLGHYLLRSRITLPGLLAPCLVEAALLALEAPSMSYSISNLANQQQLVQSAQNCTEAPPTHVCEGTCAQATQTQNPSRTPSEDGCNTPTTAANGNVQRCATATASSIQQRRLAEHGLDLLTHLINNVTNLSGPASIAALRCLINFVYEKTGDELTYVRARGFDLLSRFLTRDPNYLLKDPVQLPRLFDVLTEDNPTELKLAAAHCLRRLAVTFQDAQRQNYPALRAQLGKLERLLYENIEKPDPLCRLVAVNFAGMIYPSDHIPTRYLILQALGDKDPRVRAEACMAFEQFLDPNIIHDIVYGRVRLPSFVEFVNHDTQHSRKNPFVEVERLIPVVQFIRLCLLATRGGLTPAQEAGLTYETEDEVRYLINQNVRYFLSMGSNGNTAISSQVGVSCASGSASAQTSPTNATSANQPHVTYTAEQAKRSIDTYFRLIQVVIFTRSQHTKESPDFPNYLEEVLVGNTKELITCNKQLFDRMNNVLLATPRGANCRHACASVYSVVVMETETPTQALQTAKNMLAALPTPGLHIDGESSHAVQGMFMGAAYLLERLFTKYVAASSLSTPCTAANPEPTSHSNSISTSTSSKKTKKEKQQQQNQQQQQQKQLRSDIVETIENLVSLMDPFLISPSCLFDVASATGTKDKRSADGGFYVNSNVAQATVSALLEALMVIARAGCLSHLPAGSWPPSGNAVSMVSSKAALVHRIASYLPSPSAASAGGELANALTGQQRVTQAALRALAACCIGEGTERCGENGSSSKASVNYKETLPLTTHPHTIAILKLMTETAEVRDPSLHLAVGTAIADCLLGPASPLKRHWYERTYPLSVPPEAIDAAVSSPAGVWLAGQLKSLLTRRPGQVQTRPATLAAAFWALALARRLGPPPSALLPEQLIIDLLDEKDESVQCVAVTTLGLIYDRSSEEGRTELVSCLTKAVAGNEKKQGSPVYRELCSLAQQVGRPDLALSLIVLAIALPPSGRLSNANVTHHNASSNVALNLAASVTYAGLVRRLGRALAPALPRLVPRIFVRRFDYARPKLRQAIENVWLGLVFYASNSVTPSMTCVSSCQNLNLLSSTSGQVQSVNQVQQAHAPSASAHALASEMIEAHFNAIVCEIKTQLGFNTVNLMQPTTCGSSQSATAIAGATSPSSSSTGTKCATASTMTGTGTQNACLRDACCLAIASLTTHPSADKRLAGHLPALLSGLLNLCDEYGPLPTDGADQRTTTGTSPPEEAAIAVQKLVIRVLENPCSREAAAGLLPGLLPVIIDRAPWTLGPVTEVDPTKGGRTRNNAQLPSESRRLALELLLAAARTARPSALRPALPQLVLAGLHTMSSVHPSLVASLMRQPLHHLHQVHSPSPNSMPPGAPQPATAAGVAVVGSSPVTSQKQGSVLSTSACTTNSKELQMAEVLRLCVRLIDDVCLSRLIVPFTELIRAGGGSATSTIVASSATGGSRGTGAREAASTATATCIFISHLAAANASALAAASCRGVTCLRCSSSAAVQPVASGPDGVTNESPNGSPPHKLYTSPCGSAQSSPSSAYGLSPPTPPDNGALADTSPFSTGSSPGISDPTNIGHRCRATAATQKHALSTPGSSSVGPHNMSGPGSTPGGSMVTNSCATGGAGGGFASLVPHTGKLLAALLSALPGACRHPDSSGKIVQIEMARTLASLLRFAKDTSVAKLFNRVRSWYLHPEPVASTNAASSVSISHWACARVLHAVAHHCPELLYAHAGITLPLILVNKQAELDAANMASKIDYSVAHQATSFPLRNTSSGSVPDMVGLDSPKQSARTSAKPRPSTESLDESELIKALWQETWGELLTKAPSAPCSAQFLWPDAPNCALKSCLPSSTNLVNSFLRRPLLDHCIQLLHDALLDSPSWSVRTQASLSILHLAARLIGQPLSPAPSVTSMNRHSKCYHRSISRTIRQLGVTHIADQQSEQQPQQQQESAVNAQSQCPNGHDKSPDPSLSEGQDETEFVHSVEEVEADAREADEVSDEDSEEEEGDATGDGESAAYAWIVLVQLTAKALGKSKPWPGKTGLLRAARLLAVYARERGFALEQANQEVVHQFWFALVRETRVKRAEAVGPGYRAEAFLSLASFAEASGKDALVSEETITSDNASGTAEESADRLSSLFHLIVPLWSKRDKHGNQNKAVVLNPELNESEQELAVRAVGILWPVRRIREHLHRFAETLALLNFVMAQGSKRVQAASLASVVGILAKLSPDNSAQLVNSVEKTGGKPFAELGLKELLVRIKRAAENPKSQLLREHALGSVATLLRHPSFLALCREQVAQILHLFSNDGVASLRDCSADLLKDL